ncbi:MAG: HEPN domain-containing protein [ANME-2 cluster archaeon]|nr:MAG: HEPN domain-containing protein [ANME-2 cluster archaeon]
MKSDKESYINYRLARAWDTFDDAKILAEKGKWNSTINRLYYAAYYAVMALLLKNDLKPTTHNGAKSNFTEHYIKSQIIDKKYGKLYSQLFTWRQKGDYDDLFDFQEQQVSEYFKPVEELISLIESMLRN